MALGGTRPNLERLVIPAALKTAVLDTRNYYSINSATLFPDLGGLSAYINWRTKRRIRHDPGRA